MQVCHYDPYTYSESGITSIKPLSEDPRCLWGWGPPADKNPGTPKSCHCHWGHGCVRELGHRGKCWDGIEYDAPPCSRAQRPSDWDSKQRAECNS